MTLAMTQTVYAHFPVKDSKTGFNASFHITPDHDPIAGTESVITYDFGVGEYKRSDYKYLLTVQQIKHEPITLPITIDGEVIKTTYAFPVQGFYTINLTAQPKAGGATRSLTYSQRVTHGTVEKRPGIGLFEVSIVIVTLLFVIIMVVVINKDDIIRWKRK